MLVAHVGVIVDAQIVQHVVAAVQAVDVLGAGLQGVLLGQGTLPVELHGVLVEVLFSVLVDAVVVNGHIDQIGVARVVLVLVAERREHVTQRDGLALALRAALVVQACVEVVAVDLVVVVHAVAVERLSRGITHQVIIQPLTRIIVGKAAQRPRQQIQRVGLPACAHIGKVHGHLVDIKLGIAQQFGSALGIAVERG